MQEQITAGGKVKHHCVSEALPLRVLVLGAGGFVGRALVRHLREAGVQVDAPPSSVLDLSSWDAGPSLRSRMEGVKAVVLLAALTPDRGGRSAEALSRNVRMVTGLHEALRGAGCEHLIYVSSDAVYPLSVSRIREEACAGAQDLYGCAHRLRELLLEASAPCPLAILRPTLIYGTGDTHDAYGPGRIVRSALRNGTITLLGNGEDTRDHVALDDVISVLMQTLRWRTEGVLNVASGQSISYLDLAGQVASLLPRPITIAHAPRLQPITHRSFDLKRLQEAFPQLTPTALAIGLERLVAQERA